MKQFVNHVKSAIGEAVENKKEQMEQFVNHVKAVVSEANL